MERCILGEAGLEGLADVHRSPNNIKAGDESITSLILHGNRLTTLHAPPGQLGLALPALTSLNLSSNELSYVDLGDLAGVPVLEVLDLAANRITGLRGLCVLHRLRALSLPFNRLADLSWLSELPQGTSDIEKLDLRDNLLADASQLSHLRHLPRLRELRLCGARVHAEGGWRVEAEDANPVCWKAAYVTTVLAVCPCLLTLDGVPVSTWREALLHGPVWEGGGGRVEEEGSGERGRPPTPRIDAAASRFLQRYLSGAGPPSGPPGGGSAGASPARPGPPPDALAPVDTAAGQGAARVRLDSLEARVEQLVEMAAGRGPTPPPVPLTPSQSVGVGTEPRESGEEGCQTQEGGLGTHAEAQTEDASPSLPAVGEKEREELRALRILAVASAAIEARLTEQLEAANARAVNASSALEAAREQLSLRPSATVVAGWREKADEAEAALLSAPSHAALAVLQDRIVSLSADLGHATLAAEEEGRRAVREGARADDAARVCALAFAERERAVSAAARLEAETRAVRGMTEREEELRKRETAAARFVAEQLAEQCASALVREKEAEATAAGARVEAEEAERVRSRAEGEAAAARSETDAWRVRAAEAAALGRAEVETERRRAQAAVSAAESRLQAARAAAEEEVRRVASDASARLSAAREALEAQGARFAALTSALGDARVEVTDSARKLTSAASTIAEGEGRIARLREEVTRLEGERHAALSTGFEREAGRLGEATARADAAEGAARAAREAAEVARLSLSSLTTQLRVKEALLTDQADSMRKLKREVGSLREEGAAAEAGWREAVADLQAQLEDARASLEGAYASRDEALAAAARCTTLAEGAQAVQAQLEAAVAGLREEAAAGEEARRALAGREAALAYVGREVAGLRAAYEGKLAGVVAERDGAAREAEGARAQAETARAEAAAAREAAAAAAAAVDAARTSAMERDVACRAALARVSAGEQELRVLLGQLDAARRAAGEKTRRMAALVAALVEEGEGGGGGARGGAWPGTSAHGPPLQADWSFSSG
jgi:hypothetical protein